MFKKSRDVKQYYWVAIGEVVGILKSDVCDNPHCDCAEICSVAENKEAVAAPEEEEPCSSLLVASEAGRFSVDCPCSLCADWVDPSGDFSVSEVDSAGVTSPWLSG